ncbi:ABC-type transport auxiliary lipoprotein family protein [uncultured Caballeronia sp.]|jgi:uncharacterized protein|uniref:PqiC family protein n=1 Tax=uncultured Caballeronia sp. TaxID=1827198 RepID=UPI0015776F42
MNNAYRFMLATLLFISGCAGSPKATFYTLTPQVQQAQPDARSPIAITIGSVSVPELVDRPQLVTRVDATTVSIDEFARWADPLKGQVRRVLTADLALQFPGALVSGSPQNADSATTFLVSLDVQSFESAPGDAASMGVLWSVRAPKGKSVSGYRLVHEPTNGEGDDALVAAHSRALAAISGDIAAAIRSNVQP